MASRRQGALIAFPRDTPLEPYVQNAVLIDAEVRRLLIDGIFHPGSALHDGGVVIIGDRIAAAACIFPLTENPDLGKSVGTRHRAALGLTEETDSIVLVVSEETGAISIAHDGQLDRHVSPERLEAARPAARERAEQNGIERSLRRIEALLLRVASERR